MQINKRLILASESPRRKKLLQQIGLSFEVVPSKVSEDIEESHEPYRVVTELSHRKASAVASSIDDGLVVGADTIVVFNGRILGKPTDESNAISMLKSLSGHTHTVYTGFTILDRPSNKFVSDFEKTDVTFRTLEAEEIESYVKSGLPMDKAGSYGIQDEYGAVFIQRIEGCFYNVVGFPLTKFYLTFQKFLHEIQ